MVLKPDLNRIWAGIPLRALTSRSVRAPPCKRHMRGSAGVFRKDRKGRPGPRIYLSSRAGVFPDRQGRPGPPPAPRAPLRAVRARILCDLVNMCAL